MKRMMLTLLLLTSILSFADNVVEEYFLPGNDSVKLYTIVARPEKNKKFPVIIERSPYAKNTPKALKRVLTRYRKRNLRNFVRIYQHCRGTGKSGGYMIPYINERNDGLALLDWVRKQDFYNGEIYLSGGSYTASVHASLLNTALKDIKGIYWNVQDTERYNIIYRNNFLRLRLHASWYMSMYKKNRLPKRNRKAANFKNFPIAGISSKVEQLD